MRLPRRATTILALLSVFALAPAVVVGVAAAKKKPAPTLSKKEKAALKAFLKKFTVPRAKLASSATKAKLAANATKAKHATLADLATKATDAVSAETAATAAHATNADHATKADSATTAATATNATHVDGDDVATVYYASAVSDGTGQTVLDNFEGLTIKVTCNAAVGPELIVTTAKSNADLQVGSYLNFNFDTNLAADIAPLAGTQVFSYATPITGGKSVITRSGGAVVTGQLQIATNASTASRGFGGADSCVVAGTLVGHPPVTARKVA
jgi:hypothetical protein